MALMLGWAAWSWWSPAPTPPTPSGSQAAAAPANGTGLGVGWLTGRGRPRVRGLGPGRGDRGSAPADRVRLDEVWELIALALEGGAPMDRALTLVADVVGGAAGQTLRGAGAAVAWGLPEAVVWQQAGPDWAPVHQALLIARRAGVPPAGLLREAAAERRRQQRGRVELAAAKLPVRLVIPLGLLFLPAFMLTTVVPIVVALAREWLG